MNPIQSTSADILDIIESLAYPAVITKNKNIESENNFRKDEKVSGRWLDGYWKGMPRRVSSGSAFGIHFVERMNKKLIWIGEYSGARKSNKNNKYSFILDNVQCFEVTDLADPGKEQDKLRRIIKKPGAVQCSYYVPESSIGDRHGPCYKIAEVKQRLEQRDFRRRVFDFHGACCVVTGCRIEELLDAAHLPGRRWDAGDNTHLDGIPLRADLHRALDSGLIKLDEDNHLIDLAPSLHEWYGQYLQR